MEIYRISPNSVINLNDITICLGYFDALHLGHLTLINKSKNLGKKVGVLTAGGDCPGLNAVIRGNNCIFCYYNCRAFCIALLCVYYVCD